MNTTEFGVLLDIRTRVSLLELQIKTIQNSQDRIEKMLMHMQQELLTSKRQESGTLRSVDRLPKGAKRVI